MKSIPFDTLKYANKLIGVGFTKEQAEVQAEAIAGLIYDNLATKRDLKELEMEMKRDLKELEMVTKREVKELEMITKGEVKELEMATKRDLKELEMEMKMEFKILENKLVLKMGAMLAIAIAIITALVKLL